MVPNLSSIARRIAGSVTRVVRAVADAPRVSRELRHLRTGQAAPAVTRTPAPLSADDVKGTVPEVAEIETAARDYEKAREATNAAARIKRAAEKTLKRVPDGSYGAVTVERYESARLVIDADAVKAIFEANGLGDVPQKRCAPSLTITFADETVTDAFAVLAEVA